MIIELAPAAQNDQPQIIEDILRSAGLQSTAVSTQLGRYVIALGSSPEAMAKIEALSGVAAIHQVKEPYQLVSRNWRAQRSIVAVDDVLIGEGHFQFMAGPCSVEDEDQVAKIVAFLSSRGIKIMRAGVFKPRTSPYAFRGGGVDALKLVHRVASEKGIKLISEVLEASQIELMYPYVDVFQVGARNSQNFSLLNELGKTDKPVLIKRGISGTLDELLQSAEYVFSAGNEKIFLCERGIRTFEYAYRNTFDVNAIPVLKEKTHLPIIVDPSHGIGIRRFVEPIALAGVIAGADGLLVEVHHTPEAAKSDGAQTLDFQEADTLFRKTARLLELRDELNASL